MDAKAQIEAALADLQTSGGEHSFVIFIGDADRGYYIQFAGARGEDGLHAEAVGNKWLDAASALDAEQLSRLDALGWFEPDEDCPNHYRRWTASTPADRQAIAREVVRTFADVYGVPPDAPLEVTLNLE